MTEWLIERYVDGRLPVPGETLQWLLNTGVDVYYRLARELEDLPPAWDGSSGPMFAQSDHLMDVHYDKPRKLFEHFLGKSMKYSMGLWETGAMTVDEAQEAMMADVCRKAGVRDGDLILDVPSGFGCFGDFVMRHYTNVKMVGVTLSDVQYRYIVDMQNTPGHPLNTDRYQIVKEDFARFEYSQPFDKVISIGIFEHVWNMRLALEKVASLLNPGGKAFLHFITYNKIVEKIANVEEGGFIGRYIFPGGRLWPFREIFKYQQHLRIDRSWFLNGTNYQRTLLAWHSNFERNLDRIRQIPEMDERSIRVWDLYLRYCAAIFGGMGGRNVGNGQYLLHHATASS